MLLIAFFTLLTSGLWAQSAANYTPSTAANGSLVLDKDGNAINMSTGTTQLYGTGIDTYTNAGVQNFGFTFNFMGTAYTQWNANPDGQIRLGSTLLTGHTSSAAAATPLLIVNNIDAITGATTGKVHYKVQNGTSGKVLIVEWKDLKLNWSASGTTLSTFQARIYESGTFEFVYGQMWNSSTSAQSASLGFSSGTTAGSIGQYTTINTTPAYNTTATSYTTTSFAASSAMANLNGAADGSRRYYRFTPQYTTTPANPVLTAFTGVSATQTTLNWTDNSTGETYFIITRATDSGFTQNVVTSTVASTTTTGTGTAYASAQTGLTLNTTYYYKVQAANEASAASIGVSANQATNSDPSTYTWLATSGSADWATAGNWSPSRTFADPTDILLFKSGGSSIATGVPTQTVRRITVSNNTAISLQAAATATLTIASDGTTTDELSVASGSTLANDGGTAALTIAYSGTGSTGNIAGTAQLFSSAGTVANVFNFNGGTTPVTTVSGTFITGQSGTSTAAPTITSTTATLIFTATGVYNHKLTTAPGNIPTATWQAGSLTLISGYTAPTNNPTGTTGQTFSNFTWNCPNQTAFVQFGATSVFTVTGTFTVNDTGTSEIRLANGQTQTLTVGNYVQTGGTVVLNSGSGVLTLLVSGTFNQTGGSFHSSANAGGTPLITFNGTSGAQNATFYNAAPTGNITYRILNPAGINLLGSGTLTGTFTINGGLRISTTAATPITTGLTLAYGSTALLTYDATGSATVPALVFPAAASPASLTVGIGSGNVLTLPGSRTLIGTLTLTSGDINADTYALTLGTSAAAPGTLLGTGGYIRLTSGSFTRWFATTGMPTSAPTSGVGYFPIASGTNSRAISVFGSIATLTSGGSITVSHNNTGGLTTLSPSVADGAYTITDRTNASWTLASSGIATTGTLGLRITAANLFSSTTAANLRLMQAAAISGTYVAGSGTYPTFQVNRAGLTVAQLGQTHYIGAAAADISVIYTSIATGDWNTASTWDQNAVPPAGATVIIGNATTVTSTGAYTPATVTINTGGTLAVSSGSITTGTVLTNNGTLTVSGGTVTTTTSATNAGTVAVTSGSLTTTTTLTNSGMLNISGGAVNTTTSLTNSGTLTASGGSITTTTSLTNGGTLTVSGGTVTTTTTLTNSSGATLNLSSGTLAVTTTYSNTGTFNGTGGTLTVTGAAASGITNSGTFTLNGATVNLSTGTLCNRTFSNSGTLTVTTGNLNIFGNLSHSGTAFVQNGGTIKIDGNAGGVAANSVLSGTPLFYITSTSITLAGGTLLIVDPHTATSSANGYAIEMYAFTASANSLAANPAHITQFGDGISTDAGGNTSGFYVEPWYDTAYLSFGSVVVNSGSGTNRNVAYSNGITASGSITLNSGSLATYGVYVGKDLTVNAGATLINTYTLAAIRISSNDYDALYYSPSTVAQTFTNNGTMLNAATGSTASTVNFTVNNTSTAGVTLASPLSVSAITTLTAGKVNTTLANLLSLTATATVTGGSATAFINGPLSRTFAASRTATGAATAANAQLTLFPVGKGSAYLPIYVDPSISAAGTATFTGEAFTANAGSAGTSVTSLSQDRWEAPATSGSANVTNAFVRVGDSNIATTDKLIQATAAAGSYEPLPIAVSYAAGTPNTLTTSSALAAADYKGYFAYGGLNSCAAPTTQPTAFVVASTTTTGVSASFTAAAAPSASHYLVVAYPAGSTPVAPADYATPAAASLGTGAIILYNGPLTSFTGTGLSSSTTYDVYGYAYNNSGCFGPVFNTVSPLTTTVTTCANNTAAPGLASATALTDTAMSIAWAASSTAGVSYILEVATNSAFTAYLAGYPQNVGSALTANITGLIAGTPYYIRVKAVIGTCLSTSNTYATITAQCAAVTTVNENFNSVTTPALPSCWSSIFKGATVSQYAVVATTTTNNSAPNGAYLYNYNSANTDDIILVSPYVSNITAGTNQVRFYGYTGTSGETLTVGVVSGSGASSTFTPVQTINLTTSWAEYTVSFAGVTTAGTNIGFRRSSISTYTYVYVDDVKWEPIPSCYKPTALTVGSITTTGATFTWVAPTQGTPASYQYEVRTSGAPGSGTTGLVSSASGTVAAPAVTATVSTLTDSTPYSVYVRTFCGGSDYSEWTLATTFATLCNPIAALPWTENFDTLTTLGSGVLPVCWSTTPATSYNYTSANTTLTTYNTPRSTPNYVAIHWLSTDSAYLWTPGFQLTAGQSYDFSFYFRGDGYTGWDGAVYQNTSASATGATQLGDAFIAAATTSVTSYALVSRTFIPATSGTYFFAIKTTSNSTPYYLGYDDFKLAKTPSSITSFTPATVCSVGGQTVTLTGVSLTGATAVTFNGVPAASYTVVNSTTITAVTPSGVTAGAIAVTTPLNSATSSTSLAVTANPTVAAITGPATICTDSPATLSSATTGGTWSSLNTAIATVNAASGAVTGVAAGAVDIIYTVTSNSCSTAVSYTVTIYAAPAITSVTSGQTVTPGSTATYTVATTGSGLTYQWQQSTDGGGSWADVSGATTTTLTVSNVTAGQSGYKFRVIVTGTAPCTAVTSSPSTLTVSQVGITTQPADNSVCTTGATAQYVVVATGSGLSYVWQESVNGGTSWTAITDGTTGGLTYAGATTDSLLLTGLTTNSYNGYKYRVIITDATSNTVTSNPAVLTINTGISISSQPIGTTACFGVGTTKSFTTSYTGDGTIQWQYSANGSTWTNVANAAPAGITYTGATSSTLIATLTSAVAQGTYQYRAVITALAPCANATSNAVPLTVGSATVSISPSSATYCTGGSGVTLTASGAVSYTWSPAAGLSATTGASVVASPAASTTYTVTGTNANGCTATSSVTVSVSTAPSAVIITPSNPQICSGGIATLTATGGAIQKTAVTGTGTGVNATTAYPSPYSNYYGGAKNQMLITAAELTAMGYSAGCSITAIGFNVTEVGSSFTGSLQNFSISVGNTTATAVTANAFITGLTTVFPDATVAIPTTGLPLVVTHTFTTPFVWNGTSNIVVQTSFSNVNTGTTTTYVRSTYTTTSFVSANYYRQDGVSAAAILAATLPSSTYGGASNNRPNITITASNPSPYTWSPATGLYTNAGATIAYNGSATDTVYASPTATATYTVTATSAAGCSSSSNVTVTLATGGVIVTQPAASTTKCQGETLTLSVTATGPGLTYQWRKGGSNITGATSATYTVASALPADSGNYDVIVTPTCGAPLTSEAATVVVNPTPVVTTTLPNISLCAGNAISTIALAGTPAGVTFDVTGGAAIGLANQTGVTSIPGFTPTASGTATITVTPKANGCSGTAVTFTITVSPLPTAVSVTPSGSSVCPGTVVTLTATGGVVESTKVTGTGTNTNDAANYPSPYSNYFGGTKHQMLIRAAELTAMGYGAGSSISSVGFNVTAVGATFSGSLQNFSISIGNTTGTTVSANSFVTGLTTVFPAATVAIPTTGLPQIVTHTLATPFVWNGTSNIIIQTSYSNGNLGTSTDYVQSTYTTTTFNSTSYVYEDSATAADILGATAPDERTTNRPNIFITASIAGPVTWAPTTGLYTNAAGTIAYTGSAATTVYASPTATASYTATVTTTAGCTATATSTITVNTTTAPTASAQAFCNSATVANLTATGAGTLKWYATASSTTPLVATTALATGTYYATLTNAATSCESTRTSVAVTIGQPAAPSASSTQTFCTSGSTIGNLSVTGAAGSTIQWYAAANGGTALASSTVLATGTYYASQTINGCESQARTAVAVTFTDKTWTGATSTDWYVGTNWCENTVPTANDNVSIPNVTNKPVIGSGVAHAKSITIIDAAATLTVNSGATLSVENNIASNAATGNIIVQNNGAILQSNTATANSNTGKIVFHKFANPLYRLDYTLWSAPISGQTLRTFSMATSNNRFYVYDYADNGVEFDEGYWPVDPITTYFSEGTGYLIRMPNSVTAPVAGTTGTGTTSVADYAAGNGNYIFDGVFTGKPNNGNYTPAVVDGGSGFTAVGNPYPSPISVDSFLDANTNNLTYNTGIWFWRKRNSADNTSYLTLNLTGLVVPPGDTNGNGNALNTSLSSFYTGDNSADTWLIAPGQGFLVQAQPTAATISFSNSMRRATPGAQAFFRQAATATTVSRYWLNMVAQNGNGSQALVAYKEDATLGIDYGYDSKVFNTAELSLYSIATDDKLAIQARPGFEVSDVVPMGFTAPAAGQYTISIDHTDGLFAQGQTIYLKDLQEGITRNLSEYDYTFTTEAGNFESRFEVHYQATALGTTPILNANSVIVFKQGNTVSINTGSALMNSIKVFDVRGRLLYSQGGINATETVINSLHVQQEVLIIEIDTEKGMVSKRIIF